MSLSSLCVQVLLLSWWGEAAEAMPAVLSWMACKGGEELRCLCLLSVLKCCSMCGVRQPRPCQLLLLDGLQERRAEVSLSSLCAQVLLSMWSGAAGAMPAVVAG